jgi:hypothetical protein
VHHTDCELYGQASGPDRLNTRREQGAGKERSIIRMACPYKLKYLVRDIVSHRDSVASGGVELVTNFVHCTRYRIDTNYNIT